MLSNRQIDKFCCVKFLQVRGKIQMQDTRRVRMTKKIIKEAYIELSDSHPDKRMSITDICKAADINRSTFYMHYEDVNQLIKEIEDDLLDRIPYPSEALDSLSKKEQYLDLLEGTFEYIRENKKTFTVLLSRLDNDSFKKKIIGTVLDRYKAITLAKNDTFSKYGYLFCINGIVGMLTEWIKDNFPFSSRDLAILAFNMSVQATKIN